MPLSWNQIRSCAIAFSKDWSTERTEAQSFWNAFFHVFGIERRRVASFEQQVEIACAGRTLKHGRIDGFWKGALLIEHKSAGQSLDRAFAQAANYAAYGRKSLQWDAGRVALLFELYQRCTSLLPAEPAQRARRASVRRAASSA